MWWQDLLWGLWNGLTTWIVLIVHVFGGWDAHPIYNAVQSGNWYDFGFLVGAGSCGTVESTSIAGSPGCPN